jgi:hypothetical protein
VNSIRDRLPLIRFRDAPAAALLNGAESDPVPLRDVLGYQQAARPSPFGAVGGCTERLIARANPADSQFLPATLSSKINVAQARDIVESTD